MMVAGKKRILIVDDEETLRLGLREYLELEGYEVDAAASAEEALTLDLSRYNLILLDIMMGKMSGIELAEKLKNEPATADIPIIFLTAKGEADDMVAGLKLGADDYVTKPYSVKVLVARIEAVLRRTSPKAAGGVVCRRDSLTCTVDGNQVKLPRKEFELLALLLENPGRIFSREELLKRIWSDEVVVIDRSVDVHITRLRSKIAPYGNHIVTRSGYGYGWQD
ncbi:response regulator transcription factor [uncultured Muribaculum sp.]|uniref:response regulator transcription factor n=1 Tax=uncultured Muribaculum sp. TaxID=1918613 RepID=UPI00259A526E|nr:response regulator transcription factor [uncultured Muribaculum sp.]